MTDETYNPQKPPWDKRVPGKHPVLIGKTIQSHGHPVFVPDEPVTKTELAVANKAAREYLAEAQRLSRAHGKEIGEKQQWIADVLEREAEARLRLATAIENRFKKGIKEYRRALIVSLIERGRFAEAIKEATLEIGKPRPGFADLRKWATDWKAAEARPDDAIDACCKRPTAMIPDHTVAGEPLVEIELPRRHMMGWCFSEKYGGVCELWQCRVCKTINMHLLGAPDNQTQLHQIRKEAAKLSHRQITERGLHALVPSDIHLHKVNG